MKYNIITDLSSTHFGSYQLNDYDHNSPCEIDYKDCLFFEASQVLDSEFQPPSHVKEIKYIYSRKYRPYELFKYPYRYLLFKGFVSIDKIRAYTIFSDQIIVPNITSEIVNTDYISSLTGNINSISATSITAVLRDKTNPGISSYLGIIDNISGDNIHYENGKFGNISVTGTANLIAAAAKWADLAELYYGDVEYEPGTLVQFGGNEELTLATDYANGCISEKPGVLLNYAIRKYVNSIPLLLTGKTKVKVTGQIEKFDRIELSEIPGVAKKHAEKPILGIALETNKNDNIKLVECAIKLTIE